MPKLMCAGGREERKGKGVGEVLFDKSFAAWTLPSFPRTENPPLLSLKESMGVLHMRGGKSEGRGRGRSPTKRLH